MKSLFSYAVKRNFTTKNPLLSNIFKHESFVKRHIGPNELETKEMLKVVGVESIDQLMDQTLPNQIKLNKDQMNYFNGTLQEPISEQEGLKYIEDIANLNLNFKNYIGAGYHPTFVPPVILRNVTENPGWYTSYTPYQSEISQGRLESLLNFQTLISELTGLPCANASLLDEATAAAEAMYLAFTQHNNKRKDFFVLNDTFPYIKELIYTKAHFLGINVIEGDIKKLESLNLSLLCGALIQNPSNLGKVSDYTECVKMLKEKEVISIVSADILSLLLVKSPGQMGFDVCVGSAQRFGVPMMNGGPHAGFMSVTEDLKRKMPGRVVGISKDSSGNPAYRLALQTREQHIKREKATSNICTAQALLANMASFFAIFHGKDGLTAIANRILVFSVILSKSLKELGFNILNKEEEIFDTIVIFKCKANQLFNTLQDNKINVRLIDEDKIGITFNDTTTIEDVCEIYKILSKNTSAKELDLTNISIKSHSDIMNKSLLRQGTFLQQEVFNKYSSETQIMRYLNHLQSKDYSLVHGMIPLGSCTLKLNAAAELIPITWSKFSDIHPFSPENQRKGYMKLINELKEMLKAITQMDDVTLQPNSGSNGEYAGLLSIRRYLQSIGQSQRNLVFIPSSAHGTNPATAALCGLKPIIIQSDKDGNISVDDFKKKLELHKDNIACTMITYPSTHGVFEDSIKELCDLVHKAGGQVYIDGANMNAQVGLTAPGVIGGDVCHLNLHKTFSIPHGGGGPGVGPICVKKHLSPYLPGHIEFNQKNNTFAVSSAPYGSAGILPITFMYIKMMGKELVKSTQYSILNANYIAARLSKDYKILYTGSKGRCAHEFLIDLRGIKASTGITEEDIAKRLIDYSFHPPTMSFPVVGTLMVEPTESEDKGEVDRFIEALLSIRQEIREVEEGKADKKNNVLKNAPHTMEVIASDKWDRPYSREKAAYPVKSLKTKGKHWPAVGRVDNVYGDTNLVCTCPSTHSYI